MRRIIFLILLCTITHAQAAKKDFLKTGKYVISESINTVNPRTRLPELITIIEELDIVVDKRKFTITPKDKKSTYFKQANGFINNDGEMQFGFTVVGEDTIFSVNYTGVPTAKGYIQGKLIAIYAESKSLITGDWTMKKVTGDIKKQMDEMRYMRNP